MLFCKSESIHAQLSHTDKGNGFAAFDDFINTGVFILIVPKGVRAARPEIDTRQLSAHKVYPASGLPLKKFADHRKLTIEKNTTYGIIWNCLVDDMVFGEEGGPPDITGKLEVSDDEPGSGGVGR